MLKRKVDPISVKWYNDAVTDSQKCQHQATQEKPGFDDTTTDAVQSANIVKEIGYPIMIKASGGDTILDEKKCQSHKFRWATGRTICSALGIYKLYLKTIKF
jgi:pyruvate carboxylase